MKMFIVESNHLVLEHNDTLSLYEVNESTGEFCEFEKSTNEVK